MTKDWRCFHCDDLFVDERAARLHFGATEDQVPACQIKAEEGGLVRALRMAEADAYEAHAALHAENTDALKAWHGAQTRHYIAIGAAVELGYRKGMDDCLASIERLRRIVHCYGDRVRMATSARPDWQQEIDEAMRYVADNPEARADRLAEAPAKA